MNVLLATDHFPPFIGGAHRWAELLATGLRRRGHEVVVATVWHRGLPRMEHHGEERVPVHRVRQLRTAAPWLAGDRRQRHAPPFPDPISIRELRRIIRTSHPDVILAHGWLSFSVAMARTRANVPLVLSAHDYGYFCATRLLLHRGIPCSGPEPRKCCACAGSFYGRQKGWAAAAGVWLSRRLIMDRVAAVQSVTSFVDEMNREHLLAARPARIPRFTMPTFVQDAGPRDVDQRDVGAVLEKLPRRPFILFVGAIRPVKGVAVLFDAYRRLKHPPPLVLIGTTERDTPAALPRDAIILTDVPHPAITAAWRRALFGVVPSIWPEPGATVAIEGITEGVPMIGTAPSGLTDILGNGAGILVRPGDAAALADAMQTLIDDPGLREDLSRRGRAKSQAFQADAVLSRYEDMLDRVVAGR